MEEIFAKDSNRVQKENRRCPREIQTADDKRAGFAKYINASGIYFPNYYYLRELSMRHLD